MFRALKSSFFKKYKSSNSPSTFSRYLRARSVFTALNAKCYKNYLTRCKAQFIQNPKQFYSLVNTKRKSTTFPTKLTFENASEDTDQTMADLLAKFFQTTYSPSRHSTYFYPYNNTNSNGIFSPFLNKSSLVKDLYLVSQFSHQALTVFPLVFFGSVLPPYSSLFLVLCQFFKPEQL